MKRLFGRLRFWLLRPKKTDEQRVRVRVRVQVQVGSIENNDLEMYEWMLKPRAELLTINFLFFLRKLFSFKKQIQAVAQGAERRI